MTEEQRNEWADRYYAEMKGVADSFAEQTDRAFIRYPLMYGMGTALNQRGWHKNRNRVSLDVSKLECSDAVEMAWELEGTWNEHCAEWERIAEQVEENEKESRFLWDLPGYNDEGPNPIRDLEYELDYEIGEMEEEMDKLEERAAKEAEDIIDRWIESMFDYVWSDEFEEFVDEMEHCAA